MKIAYLDLNTNDHLENYDPNPLTSKRYGGAGIMVRAAFNADWGITLYANPACFDGFDEKTLAKCRPLSLEQRLAIRGGQRVVEIIPEIVNYQTVCFHHVEIPLNLKGTNVKSCAWSIGYSELSSQEENLLLYSREHQAVRLAREPKRIFDIVIGNRIEPFQQREKKFQLCQVSRHCSIFGSIDAAKVCEMFQIPLSLAGPIDKDYPLLETIKDYKFVKYLGVISEEEKINIFRESLAMVSLMYWQVPMNLSAVQALSYNCPIICTKAGYYNKLIQNGVNGFFVDDAKGFLAAYNLCNLLDQKTIYNTSLLYSEENMLKSFSAAFEKILND